MDLCNSNPCCSKVNYNLIFNKDQSFGLSGDQPPSEAIYRLHPLSPQEHKLRCDERGLLWITKDTPVSQEMPKISDALCQEPGEKTKYCFYYTTPSDWGKKKKNLRTRQNIWNNSFQDIGLQQQQKRKMSPERQENTWSESYNYSITACWEISGPHSGNKNSDGAE